MKKGLFPTNKFINLTTPFYYYDTVLLKATLESLKQETSKHNIEAHYAVKANANDRILNIIAK